MKKSRPEAITRKGKETPPSNANASFRASLQTPDSGLEIPATPADLTTVSHQTLSSGIGEGAEAMRAIAAAQLNITEEADGATLHCITVSQVCFKHGRITVPPGFVLASSGFSAPPPASSSGASIQEYSHSNPPPHYPHIYPFISTASSREYRDLLRGGWKDIPVAERWWVDALGGVVEEQRKANVEGMGGVGGGNGPVGMLKNGLDGAKTL